MFFMLQHDPAYSCSYVTLKTNTELEGYGLTFTIGRGNDIGNYVCTGKSKTNDLF